MRTLFDSPHFTAEYDPQNDVIFIRRHATPYASLADIPPVFDALIQALRPHAKTSAISDLREARGNNNPDWEAVVRPQVQRLYGLFPVLAVLVQTAAGKLHTQRLARERGGSGDNVFIHEADALAYVAARRR
jgi:hypothetical protein